jgi:murein DD-endopeptidase MepM/ murein hydrolase activator NlpD
MRRGIWFLVGGLVLAIVATVFGIAMVFTTFEQESSGCSSDGGVTVDPVPVQIAVSNNGKARSFDAAQRQNAATIIGVGTSRGLSTRDIKIALMVAIQESNLRNMRYGDRDSLGLFQQRPSQGWGTASQILDPVYASNKFYDALVKVDHRDSMSLLDVALAVQRPSRAAYLSPDNYFPGWEDEADALLAAAGKSKTGATPAKPIAQTVAADTSCSFTSSGTVDAAIAAARSQIGKPYIWGGTDEANGFDCSGLMQWAYDQAGVKIPRSSQEQYKGLTKVDRKDLQRGDLVFWAHNPSDPSTIFHVAMYLGNDQIIVAPRPGEFVRVESMYWNGFIGATRPVTDVNATPSGAWQMPIHTGHRSSPFGMRLHPVLHVWKLHDGQDWGTSGQRPPIYAAGPGTVINASYQTGYGNDVIIDHGVINGHRITTLYGHMSAFAPGIKPGAKVVAGQEIGLVGATGYATGEHLHFTVREDGKPVEPVQFLQERGVNVT